MNIDILIIQISHFENGELCYLTSWTALLGLDEMETKYFQIKSTFVESKKTHI